MSDSATTHSMKSSVQLKPLQVSPVPVLRSQRFADGTLFCDFGRAAFASIAIDVSTLPKPLHLRVHLGEQIGIDGRLNRSPLGSIRYLVIEQIVEEGADVCHLMIPADKRNTGLAGIRMPEAIGEVYPFRYLEVEQATDIEPQWIQQTMVHYPFADDASAFSCSDETLNAVWDICKYTIKATTFCGIYVDGDRERIPYEGDAYINQLCHYCVDQEYDFARYSHEYLLQYPTWPTEWHLHSVMMAWADYQYSGETASMALFYDVLVAKTLIGLSRTDGLVSTESDLCTRELEESLNLYHSRYIFNHGLRDLVDWPPGSFTANGTGERDNHDMRPVNTVVNAFHFHAITLMAKMAEVLGKRDDAQRFGQHALQVKQAFQQQFFDSETGVYLDGEGSNHSSLHSNMCALAFDLVPEEHRQHVLSFVKSRGMACSVYGSQYLLEALYLNNDAQTALDLMRNKGDRAWWNMIQAGSTMTLEAWDLKYKNNLDWNHAWGATPANIIPRFLMGIRPLTPGFGVVLIQPQIADLSYAEIKHPSPFGPIHLSLRRESNSRLLIELELPQGVTARLELPANSEQARCTLNRVLQFTSIENGFIHLEVSGTAKQVFVLEG